MSSTRMMQPKKWAIRLLSLSVLSALGTADVLAEEAPSIERITTTATRTADATNAMPLAISTLGEDTLVRTALTHIEEVLRYVAGATFHRGNGMEYLPALRSPVLSGAGACGGLLTAEDGIPLRAAGFCNINELFEAHSEMAERIDVLKGPGSAFYGANAIHGVINVITPDTTAGGGMLGLDVGSYGYVRGKLRAGTALDNGGVGVNASVTRDGGYRNEESVDQEKVNLRHQWRGNGLQVDTGFTYTNLDQETAGYITGFESYKDDALARSNENPEAFRKAESMRLWSRVSWQNGDDEFVITPYARDQDMQFLMHFLPGTPMEKNNQQGVGVQSVWHHQFSASTRLSMGLDAEFTRGGLLQYQDGPTVGSAFLVETVPEGKHYDYDVDATSIAPFMQVEWHADAWLITAGARFESMQYDYTNNMNSGRVREDGTTCGMGGCRYTRPESRSDGFSNLSPKLGVSYALDEGHYLYANVSRGYRAPQATELYRLQRAQTVADLDTETVDSVEFGVKGATENATYTVSAFWMDKDNVIFRDSDYFNVNDGQTRHQGIEVEVNYQLSPTWDIAVAATHARHTYEYDVISGEVNINGNDIDSAPRTQANARLRWSPTGTANVSIEWQHVSKYYTDPENLHEYEGHDLFSVRGQWQATPSLAVYARVTNLFDENYAERADYTGFSGDRYFPGRPRQFMLSVNYQW